MDGGMDKGVFKIFVEEFLAVFPIAAIATVLNILLCLTLPSFFALPLCAVCSVLGMMLSFVTVGSNMAYMLRNEGSVLLASMKRSASTNNLERFRQQPWQPRIGTASNQHPRIGSAGNLGIHKSVPLASSIHQKVPLASSIHKKVPLASSIHKKVPLASSNLLKVPLATYNGGAEGCLTQ
jgi:hypothetical protein